MKDQASAQTRVQASEHKPAPASQEQALAAGTGMEMLLDAALMAGHPSDPNPAARQAAVLGSRQVHAAQRQNLARRIGRTQGNLHLQRTLSQIPPQPAAQQATGLVMREEPAGPAEKEEINGLAEHYFVVTTTPPIVSGDYVTAREGEGEGAILKVTAPTVTMNGSVTLEYDRYQFADGDAVRAGPVQTLTNSNRIGVYAKDGKEVARYSSNLSNVRDARPLKNKGSSETFSAERPFYDTPQPVTNGITSANVTFIDRPTAPFPIHFGGGTLARIEGSDDFVTSIGIKSIKSGQIILVNPFGWSANWTMSITADMGIATDAQGQPSTHGIETWEETVGQVVDTDTYAAEIAKNRQPTLTFYTLEAAMTEPAISLWLALAAARQSDPAAVANIEQALSNKNPTFNVKILVKQAAHSQYLGLTSTDSVSTFLSAGKQSPPWGPAHVAEGQSVTVPFRLSEFINPSSITSASTLSIWAGSSEENYETLGDFLELPYPFLSGGEISVHAPDNQTGIYTITVDMA